MACDDRHVFCHKQPQTTSTLVHFADCRHWFVQQFAFIYFGKIEGVLIVHFSRETTIITLAASLSLSRERISRVVRYQRNGIRPVGSRKILRSHGWSGDLRTDGRIYWTPVARGS